MDDETDSGLKVGGGPSDVVVMSFTSRQTTRKSPHGKTSRGHKANATQSGEQIARQARVEELRQLVASGRYRVEPRALAASILNRALRARAPTTDE